jgi:hypothetical protein
LDTVIAVLMMLMGAGIAGVWTIDIVKGDKVNLGDGVLQAREGDTGSLLWPHWVAEYTTALLLLVGGGGVLAGTGWARVPAGFALGALFYTSVNSLGWVLADRRRSAYGAPMVVGIVVSAIGLTWLIAG